MTNLQSKIKALQTMLQRLPMGDKQIPLIKAELERAERKYKSLKEVCVILEKMQGLPGVQILHDLHIKIGKKVLNIDVLYLSTRFALLMDVYHFNGHIKIDPVNSDFMQNLNGTVERIPDPGSKLEKKKVLLKKYLQKTGAGSLPVESFIINTNSASIIDYSNAAPRQDGRRTGIVNIDGLIAIPR